MYTLILQALTYVPSLLRLVGTSIHLILAAGLLAITSFASHAEVIKLTDVAIQLPGTQTNYLVENEQPLSLMQAIDQHRAGKFHPGQQHTLNFGIGSHPVWLHLEVDNLTASILPAYLTGGVTWLDRLDVYVLHAEQVQSRIHSGDETPGALGVSPAIGYALPLSLSPGRSEIYLRVDSIDPLILPLELMSKEGLEARKRSFGYFYGFVYGFLGALCIYNLLLFAGLRERSYLYYSLALGSFIFCNLSYTGHGLVWLWADQILFQRYAILASMVGFSILGLLFASRFLSLAEHAPRTMRTVKWMCVVGLGSMTLFLLTESHLAATLFAFIFLSIYTVVMFLLGLLAVHQGRTSGRYFLAATSAGLLGVATTTLAVWGKIPFTPVTYHAAELGFIVESTLLAMALGYKIRQFQHANLYAEKMARQDPLTGLYNRRAFSELAGPCFSSAVRGERPLSLIMMDIDHFKPINDQYGHNAGDRVLAEIARLLSQHTRTSDIVARWGGEEFIMLLTETNLTQAACYAEQLRDAISQFRVQIGNETIALTASFGIADLIAGAKLEDMIDMADARLYQAKKEGRNRVCSKIDAAARGFQREV